MNSGQNGCNGKDAALTTKHNIVRISESSMSTNITTNFTKGT